jgi:hypothetical protein
MTSIQYSIALASAQAYAEGRSVEDPTAALSPTDRNEIRSAVLERLQRNEANRVARVEAARHHSARDAGGELTDGDPCGTSEPCAHITVPAWS